MGPTVHGRFSRHLDSLRQQFLQEGRLPFTDCLSSETVSEAMEQIKVSWNDRIFTPLVTLWVFLSQILSARSFPAARGRTTDRKSCLAGSAAMQFGDRGVLSGEETSTA